MELVRSRTRVDCITQRCEPSCSFNINGLHISEAEDASGVSNIKDGAVGWAGLGSALAATSVRHRRNGMECQLLYFPRSSYI